MTTMVKSIIPHYSKNKHVKQAPICNPASFPLAFLAWRGRYVYGTGSARYRARAEHAIEEPYTLAARYHGRLDWAKSLFRTCAHRAYFLWHRVAFFVQRMRLEKSSLLWWMSVNREPCEWHMGGAYGHNNPILHRPHALRHIIDSCLKRTISTQFRRDRRSGFDVTSPENTNYSSRLHTFHNFYR